MKKSKNLKGFTLVEEVVSLFILSILILVASGMMISAMRVYSVNVKTQSAQNKGQYVYDLLSNKLTYSSGLQYEANGVFEPTNATYYKDREVKGVFDESEVYQEIAVDKNGITKGFKGETATERVEFAPYDVEVSLKAENTATSESVAPSESPSEAPPANSSAVSSSKTTTGTTCTGESISKYMLKLTVTVKDKKGREIYERSGSISVMNYENSNMSNPTIRFPSSMNLNNTTNDGFKLRIYYVD